MLQYRWDARRHQTRRTLACGADRHIRKNTECQTASQSWSFMHAACQAGPQDYTSRPEEEYKHAISRSILQAQQEMTPPIPLTQSKLPQSKCNRRTLVSTFIQVRPSTNIPGCISHWLICLRHPELLWERCSPCLGSVCEMLQLEAAKVERLHA